MNKEVHWSDLVEQLRRDIEDDDNDEEYIDLRKAGWHYEDELPEGYPYDLEFPRSRVDGVRMFPPHVCRWTKSLDGGTYVCPCGAWR